jgi:hypothetical protein
MQRKLFKDFCANPRNLREKILLHPADIADHRRKNYSKISAQIHVICGRKFYFIPLILQIIAEKIIQRFLRKSREICGEDFP